MRSITAVEIGADTCALACTSVHGAELRVAAAETLDPAAFPGMDAFTLTLQQTRKALKLPRRCRAVVWGLPDGATRKDPVVAPLIEPLTRAGFKVARVVTPCNALGALARLRTSRTGGAMCWLGINRNGVAIVVIRPGKLLYSHSFAWDSNVGASGSQARLLQRYSLVAFLAPEVRRALAAAKQKGTTVDGIVTCGNLPDLRNLTMPLIEELDVEVETLDSLEGLVMTPELADKLSEVAPAIRLACAGAFARETRSVDESKRRRMRRTPRIAGLLAAALVALAAGGAYWWFVLRGGTPARPVPAKSAAVKSAVAKTAPPIAPPPVTKTAPSTASTSPAPKSAPPPAPAVTPPPVAAKNTPPVSPPPVVPKNTLPVSPPPPVVAKNTPPVSPPPVVPKSTPPVTPAAAANKPPVTPPPVVAKNAPVAKPPASRAGDAPASAIPPKGGSRTAGAPLPSPAGNTPAKPALHPPAPPADKPEAAAAGVGPATPLPELLKDPVPRFTAILFAADRRLATVGDEGQIVGIGDAIGRRVVVGIDERTVLLREPSGVQIRVALGGRVVGVERSDR